MKCLITGGAGFIGSHLAEYLIAEGNEVIVLDDLSTGTVRNLASVIGHPLFTLMVGSVADPAFVAEAAKGCQEIYHLAACVGVKLIVDQPLKSMCTNIDGTRAIIERAEANGARLFYASSSEVYGKCASGKVLREDDDECYRWSQSLRWSYASAKAFGEYLVKAYSEERGLSVVTGRLFNVAGPRQSGCHGMVIPRFVQQALSGQPITVYGTGEQLRCFTFVLDAVRAIVQLMRNHTSAEIYNIASSNVVTIRVLAEEVKRLLQSSSTIVHLDPKSVFGDGFEDAIYRLPNIDKLEQTIGFYPTFDMQQIIRLAAEGVGSSLGIHHQAANAVIVH